MKKLILSALAAFGLATAAYAVPAMPGLRPFMQPDGSTVTVQLVGDEHGHYYLSDDNYPLLEDASGRLCYAEIAADGLVKPSSVQARNSVYRTQAERDLMLRADAGELCDRLAQQLTARAGMKRAAAQSGMGLASTRFPSKGDIRSIAILVNYADVKFRTPNAHDYFYRLLNEEGFSDNGATGSARDFYLQSSNGAFHPTFDVYGPVDLPQNRRYYGGNGASGSDQNPAQMVIDACDLLDGEVDFSRYDADDDGIIDNIYVFYADTGEASGGPAESVWPHSWDVYSGGGGSHRYDGVLLNHYACSNEWMTTYTPAAPDGIGTFCHEFGHVLGLPDLYDTANQYSNKNGLGTWAIMAGGSYNNESRTPPTFSAYERNALGWLDIDVIEGAATVELEHVLSSNNAALMAVPNKNREFFLFENRQPYSWDKYLPDHGMLVWHIDFDQDVFNRNVVNNTSTHQYVDVVESGGPSYKTGDNNATVGKYVAFPGAANITEFDATAWGGKSLDLPITEITQHTDGTISFKVAGGVTSIGNPTNIRANVAESTPYSLSLEWDAAENANSYLLSVWTGNHNYVGGYYERSVHGTKCNVTGLQPETTYYFSVIGKAGDLRSSTPAEGSAVTTDMSFGFQKIVTYPASNVTSKGFTARWQPVDGAADYEVTISAVVAGRTTNTTADNGIIVPAGWTTSAVKNFTTGGYYGVAAPAIRFEANQDHITTDVNENEIQKLSFWIRGTKNTADNLVEVQFRPNATAEWTTAYTLQPIPNSSQTVNVDAPAGTHQARILYTHPASGASNGAIAVDDIVLTTVITTLRDVEGYRAVKTGGATSLDFVITPAMDVRDEFYYTVTGLNADGHRTLTSEPRYVNLNDPTGVDNVEVTPESQIRVIGREIRYCGEAGQLLQVYDTTGRLVGTCPADGEGNAVVTVPASGFYVAVAGNQSAKALCR